MEECSKLEPNQRYLSNSLEEIKELQQNQSALMKQDESGELEKLLKNTGAEGITIQQLAIQMEISVSKLKKF